MPQPMDKQKQVAQCKPVSKPCALCGRALQAVGDLRRNGKNGKHDWRNRKLHTKCWKLLKRGKA